jgi:hypothetical protein
LATQDKKIRVSTQKLIERNVKYLTDTIEEAREAGQARVADAQITAELVHAFVIGLLLRAKIYNDLKMLRELEAGVFALIGASRKGASPG